MSWEDWDSSQWNEMETASQEPIHLKHCGLVRETEKAWELDIGGSRRVWFPKSQCLLTENEVTCPAWLAGIKQREMEER